MGQEYNRRASDARLDKIEKHIDALDRKHDELRKNIDTNAITLKKIKEDIEPLKDISVGIKGLHVLGKLIVWIAGIIGASVVGWNFIFKGHA